MRYIESIRGAAQKHGICKIIPPKSWSCPFAIDVKVRISYSVIRFIRHTQNKVRRSPDVR